MDIIFNNNYYVFDYYNLQAVFIILFSICTQDMIQEFMSKLNSHTEQNLRFLCFRLDFNEYYSSMATPLDSLL